MINNIKEIKEEINKKQDNLINISTNFIESLEILKKVLNKNNSFNNSFEDYNSENLKIEKLMKNFGSNVSKMVGIINNDKKDMDNMFKDNEFIKYHFKSEDSFNNNFLNKVKIKIIKDQIEKINNIS